MALNCILFTTTTIKVTQREYLVRNEIEVDPCFYCVTKYRKLRDYQFFPNFQNVAALKNRGARSTTLTHLFIFIQKFISDLFSMSNDIKFNRSGRK